MKLLEKMNIGLDKKILVLIVFTSSCITLLTTGAQMFNEYKADINQLDEQFIIVKDGQLSSIAESFWDYNEPYLKIQLDGITKLREFSYVAVVDPRGKTQMEAGSQEVDYPNTQSFPLNVIKDGKSHHLGELKIVATMSYIYKRSVERLIVLLISNGIKTFIVSAFILMIIRRKVITPLQEISSYLVGLSSGNLEQLKLGKDSDQEINSVVGAINDMSMGMEKKMKIVKDYTTELEDKVSDQNNKIKQNLKEKTELVRLLCHDIANPLAVIFGSLTIMKTKFPEEEQQRFSKVFDRMERGCFMIQNLISHVRDFEAISSGKINLELSNVDLSAILKDLEILFEDRFKEKKIEFHFADKLEGQQCLAEPQSLTTQVLANLISNSIKFSHEGSSIDIEARKENNLIHLTMKDRGIGMPKEILERVFDSGSVTSRKGTNGEKGTGFGMPLVKSYVNKFGGDIEIESRSEQDDPQDHGTTIHIRLKAAS